MNHQTIDPATLKLWLDNGEAILIDVREPVEYAAEHIKGSTPLPLGLIATAALPQHLTKKLVIHCRKGGRGQTACEKILKELPNAEIFNLAGGIEAWKQAGLPLQKTGRHILPLDRQVQMTVGICILIGSLLGYFYKPSFAFIPAFFGAGLAFAGLTGFCGLLRVLAVMPWNK